MTVNPPAPYGSLSSRGFHAIGARFPVKKFASPCLPLNEEKAISRYSPVKCVPILFDSLTLSQLCTMSQPSNDLAVNSPTESPSEAAQPADFDPSPSPTSAPDSDSLLDLPPFGWHLLLCADQTKPKCCAKPIGLEAWTYLKQRIKALKLDEGELQVHRTKANCLRGCDYKIPGPVLVVYPGGYWYRSATPEAIERILQEHILGGTPVREFLVGRTPLTPISVENRPTSSSTSPAGDTVAEAADRF